MPGTLEPQPFSHRPPAGPQLEGERLGEASSGQIVLCHGLTAVRSYVVHGSKLLARRGYELISYDARGHGQSEAPNDRDYSYEALSADLASVITSIGGDRRPIVAGHSMGAHTAVALALSKPELISGLVLICPAYGGSALTEEEFERWDKLASALEQGGPEGFADEAVHKGSRDPELERRLALGRIQLHRSPAAIADALRLVPRSRPFADLDDLAALQLPVLMVASLDEIDLGHPYRVAKAWAEAIPNASLISEESGQSPLAWQGGRLSREIATWLEQPGLFSS